MTPLEMISYLLLKSYTLTTKNKEIRETKDRKKKTYTSVKILVKYVQLCTKMPIFK